MRRSLWGGPRAAERSGGLWGRPSPHATCVARGPRVEVEQDGGDDASGRWRGCTRSGVERRSPHRPKGPPEATSRAPGAAHRGRRLVSRKSLRGVLPRARRAGACPRVRPRHEATRGGPVQPPAADPGSRRVPAAADLARRPVRRHGQDGEPERGGGPAAPRGGGGHRAGVRGASGRARARAAFSEDEHATAVGRCRRRDPSEGDALRPYLTSTSRSMLSGLPSGAR